MVPIESEYSKKVSEEHVTALLRGIKANDIQKIYSMFSEKAKAFGISEYDIDRLGILRDGTYQAVDLSNLCIIDEYDYKKGRIIRSFSYRFYIKHGVYMVLIEGQQEITGSSNLIEDGMFFRGGHIPDIITRNFGWRFAYLWYLCFSCRYTFFRRLRERISCF